MNSDDDDTRSGPTSEKRKKSRSSSTRRGSRSKTHHSSSTSNRGVSSSVASRRSSHSSDDAFGSSVESDSMGKHRSKTRGSKRNASVLPGSELSSSPSSSYGLGERASNQSYLSSTETSSPLKYEKENDGRRSSHSRTRRPSANENPLPSLARKMSTAPPTMGTETPLAKSSWNQTSGSIASQFDPLSQLDSDQSKEPFSDEYYPKSEQKHKEAVIDNGFGEANVYHQRATPSSNAESNSERQSLTSNSNHISEQGGHSGIEAFVADEQVVDALGVAILPSEQEIVEVESKRLRRYMILGILTLILITLAILIPLLLKFGSPTPAQLTTPPSSSPSTTPSAAPTSTRFAEVLSYVLAYSTEESLQDPTSPQYRAADWVANEDQIQAELNDPTFAQRYLLAVFYFSTGGDDWEECSRYKSCYSDFQWLTGTQSECFWHGIRCSTDDRVTKIILGNQAPLGNNMTGTLPIEVSALSELSSLVLIQGQIGGTIPTEYGKLTKIAAFFVQDNFLTGVIPEELIQGAPNIEMLAVGNNRLSGTIPTTLGAKPLLRDLQLFGNSFQGIIPTELGNLMTSMVNLELHGNQLTGKIPEAIYKLTLLLQLSLNGNALDGTISEMIGQLQRLEILELNNNQLTGNLPDTLFTLPQIEILRVASNKLSGTLSSKLALLNTSLTEFSANNNSWTGPFPNTALESMSNLASIVLHETKLTGTVSAAICEMHKSAVLVNLTVPSTVDCSIQQDCCTLQL